MEIEKKLVDPKKQADDLLDSLRKGKSVYDMFSENFRKQYLIAGSTLEAWERKFKISIPSDLDPATCKAFDIKLMLLNQEASFYKATADAIVQALKKGSDTEFHNRFTALVETYKKESLKLPAQAQLEILIRTQLDDVETALTSANIASGFWQDILEHLAFCRKLLELGVMASGIQAKMDMRNNIT